MVGKALGDQGLVFGSGGKVRKKRTSSGWREKHPSHHGTLTLTVIFSRLVTYLLVGCSLLFIGVSSPCLIIYTHTEYLFVL
jgi:hypothetical protein